MQRHYRTQYGKAPPSDNAIRRWLKQFQETGSVLHQNGAGIQETWTSYVPRNVGMLKLGLIFCSVDSISNKTFEYNFIFGKSFVFIISGLKIIDHGNRDNNLESFCMICSFPVLRHFFRHYVPKH
jgi:hypothetical protein